MQKIPVALQLFTLRDEAQVDYLGMLKKVAEIGYDGVELAGFSLTPQEVKKALDDLGLQSPSTHAGYYEMLNTGDQVLETALAMGCSYVTCSALPGELRTAEGYRAAGEELAKIGEQWAKHGITVNYHNHNFEFVRFDGMYGFDILFEGGSPEFLKSQMDTYWIQKAGEVPADYIKCYSGRVPTVHLKDMANDEAQSFAEVGNGILDWNAIFSACEEAGTRWFIVEQDHCYDRNPVDSVRISLENMKKMGIA